MRIPVRNELIPINLISIALIAVILFCSSNTPRIILGLPFLIFFPGYILMVALFPKKGGIGSPARVALSFGMSIALVALIGLALNYTPWGIRLESVLYSIAGFIFITSIIAWSRRKQLPEQEQFGVEFKRGMPGWSGGIWDKALSIILAVSILGTLATLGYTLANPKVGEKFTEFYILGPTGEASGYPKELIVGDKGKVVVGIINHEHEQVTYWIEVTIDRVKNSQVAPVTLEHGEKWEEMVSFSPNRVGNSQKVEFLLYRQEQNGVYRKAYLWTDVLD